MEQVFSENKHRDVIDELSHVDDLLAWHEYVIGQTDEEKKQIYEEAKKLWIKRKIENGSLLLHPDVRDELIQRNYSPLSIHKKMIWASILASCDSSDSKEYFAKAKEKIIKKYNTKWWLDVYNRIKPTYAAKQRLLKQNNGMGSAVSYAAKNSVFLASVHQKSRDDALKMIPKD